MTVHARVCITFGHVLQSSMVFPKLTKRTSPMFLSRDSVTYGVVNESANILQPLEGRSHHHINNMQSFIEKSPL